MADIHADMAYRERLYCVVFRADKGFQRPG